MKDAKQGIEIEIDKIISNNYSVLLQLQIKLLIIFNQQSKTVRA